MFGWARVHASCDYFRPARYLDLLEVRLSVREKTQSAIGYDGADDPVAALLLCHPEPARAVVVGGKVIDFWR